MFGIAVWVIVTKAIELTRIRRANLAFLDAFRPTGDEVFRTANFDSAGRFADSPLFQLFRTATQELQRRLPAGSAEPSIGPKTMGVIRAAIDATAARQGNRLNRLIVLLTIAISGGPFIGLLGTVVGVMITFAAIAAIGDVNINSIAPGIAAALLATVAGLAVAIPSLFAYNWLASRIKELSGEMAIFSDELTTRIAESFER
jgi:biopolymer transport protein ExbB